MKWIFPLCIQLFLLGQALGADSIYTYVFTEEVEWNLTLTDSMMVVLDARGTYNIEEVLQLPGAEFTRLDPDKMTDRPIYGWSRIRLVNATSKPLEHYLQFCSKLAAVEVYTIENGQVTDRQQTGYRMPPIKKDLPVAQNYVRYTLEPGQQRDFYFRVYLASANQQVHLSELFIKPAQALILFLGEKYASQSFYAGIMLLFVLVSLFMYGMFRESMFIYFALLMLSFVGYFLVTFGILGDLLFYAYEDSYMYLQRFFISGIVVSYSLFGSFYLRLPQHYPRFYRWYLYGYIFVALFPLIVPFLTPNEMYAGILVNIVLVIWIVMVMTPMFLLAIKNEEGARILLISIFILFLGSLVQILRVFELVPFVTITKYAMQIGTILFSGLLFYGLFDRINTIRNEKQRFEELDQLKSRFFANISHEFRTPLTLVMGPIQQVLQEEKEPKNKGLLQLAYRNAGRLLQLINQLLDLSKLEAGKMELKVRECNFSTLLKGIVMSFESLAAKKNINLHFVSENEQILLFVDQNKIEQIFYNLLSNAFKFTPENGEVSVMVTDRAKEIGVLIRDTGIGIPASRLPYIFNRFYQVDSSETREQEGTGIGLALVKELVQLHSGRIRVESTEGEGTQFMLSFPKGNDHFKEEDFVEETVEAGYPEKGLPNPIDQAEAYQPVTNEDADDEKSDARPTVLIIEDNADVRAYIRQHLVNSFQILEAVNGQEGIDAAMEHQPDLVISDVMMPLKNGYEVCETLKTDERTSHIPVIMLTAKAAQEEKMQGLETGADDYLVKPFDTRELEVRVRNLIEIRRKLRQRFAQADTFEPQELGLNSVDKAFLEKLGHIVEVNLANEQFSVEMLAEEMAMSRVHLNRKLKALTDESANKFIRSFRLQRAMKLLKNREGNVSEIAFATGFSSTAYFVKCFGDKYAVTPGAILHEQ